jgi:hypothetical protein
MGGDKMAIVTTFPHSDHAASSPYLDDYADEPIIVVCSMNSGGGDLIRKAFSKQKSSREIKVGSVNLHVFMELEDIYGKAPHTSGKIVDIDASSMGDDVGMGKIIGALGPSFERIHSLVKANPDRWKGRWYGLLKREWGEEKRHDQQQLTVKERFIPKSSARLESFTKGLDPGNLEPVESPNRNAPNVSKYQPREGNRMINGFGISPGPNYLGLGDRERGRSRSKSRGREDSVKAFDISNLKALHKEHSFDTLKSPKEAEARLRASSPSTRIHDYQKIEGENKPQTKLMYGIGRRPVIAEGSNTSGTNHRSSSQGGESHEGNGGLPSEAK